MVGLAAGGKVECARGGKEGKENCERSEPIGGRRGGRRKRKERVRILFNEVTISYISRIRFPLVVLCIVYLAPLHSKDHSSFFLVFGLLDTAVSIPFRTLDVVGEGNSVAVTAVIDRSAAVVVSSNLFKTLAGDEVGVNDFS